MSSRYWSKKELVVASCLLQFAACLAIDDKEDLIVDGARDLHEVHIPTSSIDVK